jgi:hypothetical protein
VWILDLNVWNLSKNDMCHFQEGCLFCWDWVSLCSPVWPQNPPASASQVLGFQVCATMHAQQEVLTVIMGHQSSFLSFCLEIESSR